MEVLIDYLSFTDKEGDIQKWLHELKLENIKWQTDAKGRTYGWQKYYYYHGIHLRFGGRNDVGIELTGTGCRFLETCNNCDFDWVTFLIKLENSDFINISRLDVACDDWDQILNIDTLIEYTKSGSYISKARRKRWIDGDEQEIIFGSPSSSTRLRIYNKALERQVDQHWIRSEFQFRDEAADSFIKNLSKNLSVGATYSGVLVNYLRYTEFAPDCNNNNSRIPTVTWWAEFTNYAQRIKNVKVGGLSYNYEDLVRFITTQCTSSLKTFIELCGGNPHILLSLINNAELNTKQKTLIENRRIYNA